MAYDRRVPYFPCSACGEPTRSSLGVCKRPSCSATYYKAWRETDLKSYREKVREGNRVRAAAWRAANPEKEKVKSKRWSDANPDKVAAKSRRWREANAERVVSYAKAWTQANPEKNQAKEHRRRARKANVPSSPANLYLLVLLQKGACPLCDTALSGPLDLDHIIPLSLGGWDVPGNLALTHAGCNRRKNNRVSLTSPECTEAKLRAELFVQRCPELVIFPSGGGYNK